MGQRNVGSEVDEVKKDFNEVAELKKRIKPLREAFKKIAPTNKGFQDAIEHVTKQQSKNGISVVYTLLQTFDQYTKLADIHHDFDALVGKWQKECKEREVSSDLAEGGRLLLETYRCHFVDVFNNKWRTLSSAHSGSKDVKSLGFNAIVGPLITTIKDKILTTDTPVKQWRDLPFKSLNDPALNEVKKLNDNIESHRKLVADANKVMKTFAVEFNSIESLKQKKSEIADLAERKMLLEAEEKKLSDRHEHLSKTLNALYATYQSELKVSEEKHHAEYDRLPVIKRDFDGEFKESHESKEFEKLSETIKLRIGYKQQYFQSKMDMIAGAKTLQTNLHDFNVEYNDMSKGRTISEIVVQLQHSIRPLLDSAEDLVQGHGSEISTLNDTLLKEKDILQKKKAMLFAEANKKLTDQLKKEAVVTRESQYQTHLETVKKELAVFEVETKGVEVFAKALYSIQRDFDEKIKIELNKYKEEFVHIQKSTFSSQEFKERDLDGCKNKQEKLKALLDRTKELCEVSSGLTIISPLLPKDMRDFYDEVTNYANKMDDFEIQWHINKLKANIQEIQDDREREVSREKKPSAIPYAIEFIRLKELQKKINLYKEIFKQNPAFFSLGKDALDDAMKNYGVILNKHILNEFNSYRQSILAQKDEIISSLHFDDKAATLRGLALDISAKEKQMQTQVFDQIKEARQLGSKQYGIPMDDGIDLELAQLGIAALKPIVTDDELACIPTTMIARTYPSLQEEIAGEAFKMESKQHPTSLPVRPKPLEPKWSWGKFICGLVLGVVGGCVYWCRYQSEKEQYQRDLAVWQRQQTQAPEGGSRVDVRGGTTGSPAFASIRSDGHSVQMDGGEDLPHMPSDGSHRVREKSIMPVGRPLAPDSVVQSHSMRR